MLKVYNKFDTRPLLLTHAELYETANESIHEERASITQIKSNLRSYKLESMSKLLDNIASILRDGARYEGEQ